MPVMPAPTTSTSTSGLGCSSCMHERHCTDRLVYGRMPTGTGGLPWRSMRTRSGRRAVPFAMEVPDRVTQGALLRRGLLPAGGRTAVAARLADGVPARGDPAAARLRRVRDPRSVDHRGAHRRHGRAAHSRTRAATAASRSSKVEVRATSGFTCPFHGWCYGLDGKNTFVPRTRTFSEHNLQPDDIDLGAGAVRSVGRMRVDQPRRRRAAAAAVSRAGRHHPRRVEGRSRCGPSGGTPSVCP